MKKKYEVNLSLKKAQRGSIIIIDGKDKAKLLKEIPKDTNTLNAIIIIDS